MGEWQEIKVRGLDLGLTLASGQFFRYREEDEHYVLLTHRSEIRLAQHGNTLLYRGADSAFVTALLNLTRQHDTSFARIAHDPILSELAKRYAGLRIMRQDLHECIVAFICSSNSNIPRIRACVENIARDLGTRGSGHAFLPKPGEQLDEEALWRAGLGYRAPYLAATNAMLTQDALDALRRASYSDAYMLLCKLPGIGPKVADCICLFALGHGEAFPVDVHVLRAMRTAFPRARLATEAKARAYAQQRWGRDAGLAQQLLYQWAREQLTVRA